jgi:hypothetical protein
MRKRKYILLVLSTCLLLFSAKPETKVFSLKIVQGGEEFTVKKSTIKLKKAAFAFLFEFDAPMGIDINASFEPETYKNAKSGKPIGQLLGFTAKGMAENERNIDREILMSNKASCYWFYTDNKKNSFDETSQLNNKIICKRTVEKLYRIDIKESAKITELSRPLYLVLICTDKNGSEVQRQCICIKWE